MNVLRLLREPRWLRGLAVAVLVALVCCVLGRWQWHRREERLAANAPLVANYDADPVALSDVLAPGGELADADVWTPVELTGSYDTEATVLARNRPRDEQTGYEVLVPFTTTDGATVVVDRGWIAAGDGSTERPDTVPAAPEGTVTLTVRLRQFEDVRRGTVPAGQVGSIAQTSVEQASGLDVGTGVVAAYGLLASEDPAGVNAPLKAVEPSIDEGPHLAYTVQWFGFALTAFIVWVVAGRRELAARAEGDTEEAVERATTEHAPLESSRSVPTGARGKRRREGLDEAAEDAELDTADRL